MKPEGFPAALDEHRRSELPLVSVVTACFNGAEFLAGYLEGLQSQTYKNIEIVFVDDGSTDGTERIFKAAEADLCRQFTGRVIYLRQDNKGVCAAVNMGYAASSGELLAPCDSDDIMLPNKIADHVSCFRNNPDAALVYGDYYLCDESGRNVPGTGMARWAEAPSGRAVFEALLRHGMFIKCGAYCFRREWLRVLPNGSLEETDPGQNLSLLLRIAHHANVAFHPNPVVRIVQRQGSLTRNKSLRELQHAFRSKKIVDNVIRDLGCPAELVAAVERRYLPAELRYHLVTGDPQGIRQCCWRAIRIGMLNRYIATAFLASYLSVIRSWLIRRRFPDWADLNLQA